MELVVEAGAATHVAEPESSVVRVPAEAWMNVLNADPNQTKVALSVPVAFDSA